MKLASRLRRSFRVFLNRISVRIALVFILLLVPLSLVEVLSIRSQLDREFTREAENLAGTVSRVYEQVLNVLDHAVGVLQTAAGNEAMSPTGGPDTTRELERLHRQFPRFTNLSTVDRDGYIRASSTGLPESVFVGDSENIRTAMQDASVGFSRLSYGVITGMPTVVVSYPLTGDDGTVEGTINAGIDLTWLSFFLDTITGPDEHLVSLIDGSGEIFAINRAADFGAGDFIPPDLQSEFLALARQPGQVNVVGGNGLTSAMASARDLPGIPGNASIVAAIAVSRVQAAAISDVRNRIITLVLTLFGTLVVAWFVTRWLILRPLDALQEAVQKVTAGNLSDAIISNTVLHEFEPFRYVFNDMARELSVYRQTLEQRIQERTRQYEAAAEEARMANEAKDDFLASMSHEIRTPLNGLLGMLQLVHTDSLSSEDAEYVALARESGSHLLTLMNDLLNLARLERGAVELDNQSFDVPRLVERLVREFRLDAQQKGVELTLDTACTEPLHEVHGDRTRTRQVLSNLIGNALKFTERGYVRVHVVCEPVPPRHVRYRISVEDSGQGIPADKIDQIFERFAQAERFIARRHGGAGLGLAISRHLARLMGGDIRATSTIGEGSTFTAELVFETQEDTVSDVPAAQDAPEKEIRPGLSVLVAEDDRISRIVLQHMVERLGHTVDTVESGSDAMKRLEERAFHLVLADIQMPGMSGIDLLRAIHARSPQGSAEPPKVVAVTGHVMPGDREGLLQAGMDGYLSKPVETERLAALIAELFPESARPIEE